MDTKRHECGDDVGSSANLARDNRRKWLPIGWVLLGLVQTGTALAADDPSLFGVSFGMLILIVGLAGFFFPSEAKFFNAGLFLIIACLHFLIAFIALHWLYVLLGANTLLLAVQSWKPRDE